MSTPPAVLPEILEQGPDFVATSMEVAAHDVIFEGHYPGSPVYPGVRLVECVHQSVSAALRQCHAPGDRAPASEHAYPAARRGRRSDHGVS